MKRIGISIFIGFASLLVIAAIVTPTSSDQLVYLKSISKNTNCAPLLYNTDSIGAYLHDLKNQRIDTALPAEYMDALNIALSHYPELNEVDIKIEYAEIGTTLQVQPRVSSVFGKKKSRQYLIKINSDKEFQGIYLKKIPFNAKVGLFAHELGHILDYENKNAVQIIGTALKFLTKESQMNYEKSIDELTIHRGLGNQLYDWAEYAMHFSSASSDYKQFKKDIYLEPIEIKNLTTCPLDH